MAGVWSQPTCYGGGKKKSEGEGGAGGVEWEKGKI